MIWERGGGGKIFWISDFVIDGAHSFNLNVLEVGIFTIIIIFFKLHEIFNESVIAKYIDWFLAIFKLIIIDKWIPRIKSYISIFYKSSKYRSNFWSDMENKDLDQDASSNSAKCIVYPARILMIVILWRFLISRVPSASKIRRNIRKSYMKSNWISLKWIFWNRIWNQIEVDLEWISILVIILGIVSEAYWSRSQIDSKFVSISDYIIKFESPWSEIWFFTLVDLRGRIKWILWQIFVEKKRYRINSFIKIMESSLLEKEIDL